MTIHSILFVCTGNICRSPTADAVMRKLVPQLNIDSAGTHDYHVGEAPDPRSIKAAEPRGYDLSPLRARKVERADFNRFELILAMDAGHYHALSMLRPKNSKAELALFLDYVGMGSADVPDPYYGGSKDFDACVDLVEEACGKLMVKITK